MTATHKPTGRASSMPGGIALGAAVWLMLLLASTGLIAWLVLEEHMGEEKIGYAIMVMLLVASWAGAAVSAGRIKRQRLLVCALSGAVDMGILLMITALFFGGQYEAVGVTALLVLGGAMVAFLLHPGPGRGGKTRKIRRRNR